MNNLQQLLRLAPMLTHAHVTPKDEGIELRLAEFDLPNEDGKAGSPAVPVLAIVTLLLFLTAVFIGLAIYAKHDTVYLCMLAGIAVIVFSMLVSQIDRLARSQRALLMKGKITVRTRGIIPASPVEFSPGEKLKITLRKRRVGPDIFRYRLDLTSSSGAHRYVSLGTNYNEVLWLVTLFETALDTHVIRAGRY